jgi:hypothetical protein
MVAGSLIYYNTNFNIENDNIGTMVKIVPMYRTLSFFKFPALRCNFVAKRRVPSRSVENQTEKAVEFPDLERKKQELHNHSAAACKGCSNFCLKYRTCILSRKRTPLDNRVTSENDHLNRAIAYHKNDVKAAPPCNFDAVSNRKQPSSSTF